MPIWRIPSSLRTVISSPELISVTEIAVPEDVTKRTVSACWRITLPVKFSELIVTFSRGLLSIFNLPIVAILARPSPEYPAP